MFFALGAASSAINALKALTSSKSSAQTTGVSQNSTSPFDLMSSTSSASVGSGSGSGSSSGSGGGSQISPQTMSALLDAQSQSSTGSTTTASKSRSSALKDLFGQIDGDGDGKISKSEFEDALGAGGTNLANADSVFGKLDKDGDGSVSLKELASALKGGKGRGHHAASTSSDSNGSNSDPFAQALQGASTTSVTNSDGSVTTSLTYADGSKVTMTSAASGSSSSAATSSYNFIEQMIQRQAQAISSGATASLSVSA
jgi:Ca2+-binding EF-hand superfamily protein